MEKITVKGSTSYNVVVEHNILDRVGELMRNKFAGKKALIVTDSNVAPLYLHTVETSFKESGYETYSITLAPGDESKSIDNYVNLLQFLADHHFAGSDIIVGLGGGMIGDLAGFVAATYKRGMKCVLVPTTLLAMVDASVGGKTAVNMSTGKNQVGIIRNPSIVLCDPNTLSSLSRDNLKEGYAEIIKYGILTGSDVIDMLRTAVDNKNYYDVICISIAIKRDVVVMDEGDKGIRQFLNLGHLVGHAIEAATNYSISHGKAVAAGLAIEARAAAMSGFAGMSTYLEIASILKEFHFDITHPYNISDLEPYLVSDKRIDDSKIKLIIPVEIGNCVMKEIEMSELVNYLKRGL